MTGDTRYGMCLVDFKGLHLFVEHLSIGGLQQAKMTVKWILLIMQTTPTEHFLKKKKKKKMPPNKKWSNQSCAIFTRHSRPALTHVERVHTEQ